MTAVWLCEPRSHGRRKEVSPLKGATSKKFCRTPSTIDLDYVQ